MERKLRAATIRARALRASGTPAEQVLWQFLRGRRLCGAKFRRQAPFGPYIVDFYCDEARLVVEADGAHHFPPPPRDLQRDAFFREQAVRVARFSNERILRATIEVLDELRALLTSTSG